MVDVTIVIGNVGNGSELSKLPMPMRRTVNFPRLFLRDSMVPRFSRARIACVETPSFSAAEAIETHSSVAMVANVAIVIANKAHGFGTVGNKL